MEESQRRIKAKYLYNKLHDADSIVNMMKYLAASDKKRNRQEATAPENSETANMVNLGIECLQQLVQQPTSDYASTDSDDKSVMAATSDNKSLVEKTRYRTRGCKKYKKGRRHRHRS